eukprot:7389739-Prymnesium_polylepis.1
MVPPDNSEPSCPALLVSLHALGGFCAVSTTLPLPKEGVCAEVKLTPESNGLNAAFGESVHCVAAEPHAAMLRVGVIDGKQEVAYETAILGRLRVGYRVLNLRSLLGTRIEICYLLLRISVGLSEVNFWPTPRQLRLMSHQQSKENDKLNQENIKLQQELQKLRSTSSDDLALSPVDLCAAAAMGNVEQLRALVAQEAGFDINRGDYDRRTALHLAASEGQLHLVKMLVDELVSRSSNPNSCPPSPTWTLTPPHPHPHPPLSPSPEPPLHLTPHAHSHRPAHEIIRMCARSQGADASPVDRWNGTPLDDAMRSGHAPVVAYLRAKGDNGKDGGTGVVAPSPTASCNGSGRSGREEIPREQSNGAPARRRMSEGQAGTRRRLASKELTIRPHLSI